MALCPSINTTQHLSAMQRQYVPDRHPDEVLLYKFYPPEWKYEAKGAHDHIFAYYTFFAARCAALPTKGLMARNEKPSPRAAYEHVDSTLD